MLLTLKDFFEITNYRITEGSEFCWNCFGANAYMLDYWSGDPEGGFNIGVVFDRATQVVYEMIACDYDSNEAFRWTNPDVVEARQAEATQRGVNVNEAWDDIEYQDLDAEEFAEVANTIGELLRL